MVEVFKTNIDNAADADHLLILIHLAYPHYSANFDLEDCDKILRVESWTFSVDHERIIQIAADAGYYAEVLADLQIEVLQRDM